MDYPTRLFAPDRARSVCFTGHRELRHDISLIRDRVSERVYALWREGFHRFYSGGAYGFDLIAASAVVGCIRAGLEDIELVFALPFPGHDSRWHSEDREFLARLLPYAAEVVHVSPHYHTTAYALRNRYIIERSAACIAYYDTAAPRSGTGQTVRLARSEGLAVHILP